MIAVILLLLFESRYFHIISAFESGIKDWDIKSIPEGTAVFAHISQSVVNNDFQDSWLQPK